MTDQKTPQFPHQFPLGTCWFPEHWDKSRITEDVIRMAELGLSLIRLGEFAWNIIEPEPGVYDWSLFDEAMNALHSAGLKAMLCTPTATPPKWLMDRHDDILARDDNGQPRKFGSRRHYCFSSQTYRKEAARITTAIAQRYSGHPALAMWQTDNEYGCHNTTRSFSPMAREAFRVWLATQYSDIKDLNARWGNVFWSQRYRSFDEIDLPNQTVTEANPSHWLDFYRFSSDEVISFNKIQCDIIRGHSDLPITHNAMGEYFEFDHHKLGQDLDIITWDSYPLGFLDISKSDTAHKLEFMRQGDPDFTALTHDLYRGACDKWAIIEQQPGPVNWANHNPAPLPGMVRLWSWEAFAHNAEFVSYFRYRGFPQAQEQMHAGMRRHDDVETPAWHEAAQIISEQINLPEAKNTASKIALVFSYDAQWMFEAHPQGAAWDYQYIVLEWYGAARDLGMNIDVVSPDANLDDYDLVLIPSLPHWPNNLSPKLRDKSVLIGPRSGSKTHNLGISDTVPDQSLKQLVDISISHSESFNPAYTGPSGERIWQDHIEAAGGNVTQDAVSAAQGKTTYLTTVLDRDALRERIAKMLAMDSIALPKGLRLRTRGNLQFAFNYSPQMQSVPNIMRGSAPLIGDYDLMPAQVCIWDISEN